MENKTKKINTIFIGTPNFAVPGLQALVKDSLFNVSFVITQIDKKIGRKHILSESPVKQFAKKHNINILQAVKISEIFKEIEQENPDLIVVTAYGQLIPKNILDLPKYGCINIHASLLPKYRGAACIQAAISNLDKKTGLTIMKMDTGLDTGPIIYQEEINIKKTDDAETISQNLAKLSASILTNVLKKYINRNIKETAQDNNLSTYVGLIKKEDGLINYNQNADKVDAHIRAMSPWPGAYSFLDNTKIKIIETGGVIDINSHSMAELFIKDTDLFVQCKKDSVQISKVQIPGKNIISSDDFIRGYARLLGKQFSQIKAPTHQ